MDLETTRMIVESTLRRLFAGVLILMRTGLKVPLHPAAEIMEQALKTCDMVIQDRPIEVYAAEVGNSGINWEISWWAGAIPREMRRSRHAVLACLLTALNQAGIDVPTTIHQVTMLEMSAAASLPSEHI